MTSRSRRRRRKYKNRERQHPLTHIAHIYNIIFSVVLNHLSHSVCSFIITLFAIDMYALSVCFTSYYFTLYVFKWHAIRSRMIHSYTYVDFNGKQWRVRFFFCGFFLLPPSRFFPLLFLFDVLFRMKKKFRMCDLYMSLSRSPTRRAKKKNVVIVHFCWSHCWTVHRLSDCDFGLW